MKKYLQSMGNEQGNTKIIFIVVMIALAFLLHPKTSPFAEHYYNFKAESQLKQLYDSCSLVWASDGQHNVSAANKGKKGAALECDMATAVMKPYNFIPDRNVNIDIKNGTKNGFSATAKHNKGTVTVTIGVKGSLQT